MNSSPLHHGPGTHVTPGGGVGSGYPGNGVLPPRYGPWCTTVVLLRVPPPLINAPPEIFINPDTKESNLMAQSRCFSVFFSEFQCFYPFSNPQ